MKNSRRSFLRQAGVAGIATSIVGPLAASASSDSKAGIFSASELSAQSDPSVSKYTGPHGEGLPIAIAGYDYNRVRGIVDGSVNVKGCSSKFEVSGIGPLNNHAFFGPQTRDVTEVGLIPYILAYANDEYDL